MLTSRRPLKGERPSSFEPAAQPTRSLGSTPSRFSAWLPTTAPLAWALRAAAGALPPARVARAGAAKVAVNRRPERVHGKLKVAPRVDPRNIGAAASRPDALPSGGTLPGHVDVASYEAVAKRKAEGSVFKGGPALVSSQ
eukprot:gene2255-biopygen12078